MRIALVLEYDGRAFLGWQSQPGGNTVQDAVETAVAAVADRPTRVICAGRTDTGVHATAQVAHFDTDAERPLSAWVRGVNAHLPDTVAVCQAQLMPETFHARFSATGRHYRYLLLNRAPRPGVLAGRVGWYHRELDASAMQDAAWRLCGEQDFSSFRSAQCQARSPVRTLHRLTVRRENDVLLIDAHANAFLHHMVRNLVGCLIAVGNGTQAAAWVSELLAARNRGAAPATFSPAGLYLTGVDYDGTWNLKVGAGETALLNLCTRL